MLFPGPVLVRRWTPLAPQARGVRRRPRRRSLFEFVRLCLWCPPYPDWTAWTRSIARNCPVCLTRAPMMSCLSSYAPRVLSTRLKGGERPRPWQLGVRDGAISDGLALGMRPTYAKSSANGETHHFRRVFGRCANKNAEPPRGAIPIAKLKGEWSSGVGGVRSRTKIPMSLFFKIAPVAQPPWRPPDAPMPTD